MSAALSSSTAGEGSRAIIVAALMASFMQSVVLSLPNAALLYLQGTLSMADDEVGWVFTSYIAASIITMPMTRWLAGRYGRKTMYLLLIAIFAFGLVLAVRATTPMQFVAARIIQGAASGPLAPLSIAILFDILPPSQRARINLVIAVTLIVGILSGPSIGGWLSEYHDWPSMFYSVLPMAGFIFLAMSLSLPETRAEHNPPFDFFGWTTLSLGMIGLQMLLDRGERLEWFDSAEIWAEAIASVLGFYLYFVHVLTMEVHFLDKALFRDRNFVLSAIMYFAFGFVLLPTIALTSPMLDEILNYPADTTGYMAIPRSIALVGALIVTARIVPARTDNRPLLTGGMALVVYANWRMLGYSPEMDWRAVVLAGAVQGAGLGILLPTLTKTAFSTLDPAFRPEGTAFFNLSRLYGSSIGVALVLFFYDNTQAMHLALAKDLTPYRAAAHVAGSVARPGLATLNDMVTGQAAFVGVIDQFKVMMIAMLIVSPLVLFLRKPRPTN